MSDGIMSIAKDLVDSVIAEVEKRAEIEGNNEDLERLVEGVKAERAQTNNGSNP